MKGRLMYASIMVVKASRLMAFVPTTGCRYYIARRMSLSRGGNELPKRLSPSSIVAWRQCPLLFKLRYIDKIPEPTTTVSSVTLLHPTALKSF